MPSAIDTTTEIQQKFLAGLEASQRAVVTLVGTWAETVESVVSKLPELAVTEPVKPTQALETMFGFTEKVLASQRDFAGQVFQAAMPATRAPAAAANTARAASAKV
jgi:hypothetical protein